MLAYQLQGKERKKLGRQDDLGVFASGETGEKRQPEHQNIFKMKMLQFFPNHG